MENLYYLYNGRRQREANEQRKWAKTYGPRKQDRIERVVHRRLEQFNLQGFIVQGSKEREDENSEQQGLLAVGKWSWDYPKYEIGKTLSKEWEGVRKFHDLMWDMQMFYEDNVWQQFREKEIDFTYRSQFERTIEELPEKLQALIFSKVWNNGKKRIRAHGLGATHHRRYHYKQEDHFQLQLKDP